MKTKLQLINHASVLITGGEVGLLTDPWYEGAVFHNGWRLLKETSEDTVTDILSKTTHIWISHEHPDHFSVSFFKRYSAEITRNNITVLFQKTRDRRVINFLHKIKVPYIELPLNSKIFLSNDLSITCIPDGNFDSALLVQYENEKILNLNDCVVRTRKRAQQIYDICGKVDVLLTQFSYAAWKGGKKNKKFRIESAKEKLESMRLQLQVFNPKFLVPFASFIYFSNVENFYLNDSGNTPEDVVRFFKTDKLYSSSIVILKPLDYLHENLTVVRRNKAVDFWARVFQESAIFPKDNYGIRTIAELEIAFIKYCDRIQRNNNMFFIKIIRALIPIKIFSSVVVKLKDTGETVRVDYVNRKLSKSSSAPMIEMRSESLEFLFLNSFGFDTLTVNGCFEESRPGGFSIVARSLGIEGFNNAGISIGFSFLFNFELIIKSLIDLGRVTVKLR